MATDFCELKSADGSWQLFRDAWARQCTEFGEEIDNYAPATMGELAKLAHEGHERAGVYALPNGANYDAVCQTNCVGLPGFDTPVLRVRFMTLSPEYDFGDHTVIDYGHVLVALLLAAIRLSTKKPMKARYIKLHLRSPADHQFFAAIGSGLNGTGAFDAVEMKGSWLHITKKV